MPRLFRPARAAPAAQPLADGGFVCVALPLRGGGDATAAPRAAQPVSQLARAVVAPMKGRVIEAPNPKSPLEQFRVLKIDGDGRCMFRATVQGLASLRGLVCGPEMETREADLLRVAVAEALCTTPDARAAHPDAMFAVKVEFKDLKSYCTRLASPRFWGGEAEMLVLASILKQPIAVYLRVGRNAEWPDGFRKLVTYGDQFSTTKSGKAREPVRLLFNGSSHYDCLLPLL